MGDKRRFQFDWKNWWKFSTKWNSTSFHPEKNGTGVAVLFGKVYFFSWKSLGANILQQQTWLPNLQWCLKFFWMVLIHFTLLYKKMMTCYGSINCSEKFESVPWVFRTNRTPLFYPWISKSPPCEKDHFRNLKEGGSGHASSSQRKPIRKASYRHSETSFNLLMVHCKPGDKAANCCSI